MLPALPAHPRSLLLGLLGLSLAPCKAFEMLVPRPGKAFLSAAALRSTPQIQCYLLIYSNFVFLIRLSAPRKKVLCLF